MTKPVRVPGKGRICAITEKLSEQVSKNGRICVYQKMVESRRVPGKGRIRVSTEKLFGRVHKNARITVSTGKW